MNKLNYYSGRFTGLYKRKGEVSKGAINFHTIKWDYVNITEITNCSEMNLEELKAGAFYYTPLLKARISKWDKITGRNTSIFIPKQADQVYTRDLENFLVRDIDLDSTSLPKITRISPELYQINGIAYFSVPKITESIEKAISNEGDGDGKNVFGDIYLQGNGEVIPSTINLHSNTRLDQFNQSLANNSNTSTFGGCMSVVFRICFTLIIGSLLYYLWLTDKNLFWLLGVIASFWFFGQFAKNKFWTRIGGLGIFVFFIYYLQSNHNYIKADFIPKETKEGKIKIYPPVVDTNNTNPNVRDYSNKKLLHWWDFINNSYNVSYSTSSLAFRKSTENRELSISKSNDNVTGYFSQIYEALSKNDIKYLDTFMSKIQEQRRHKSLNIHQTAEMVVSMIQEIPYVLVHDMSCEKLLRNSQDPFIHDYHKENKPCLPNIGAGVQAPYEFLHNLKGDCDTRALLGFTILKQLKIPTSVWISNSYGHSVLGVGIPTQGKNYKIIGGVKHYPVELTAKGFRLGMIAPSQRNMNNWSIAIYNN
jgi:hypothetical protein